MTDCPAVRPRILIDASPVTNSNDGLSVYIINLIANLPPESLGEFEFTVLINPDVERTDLSQALNRDGITILRHRIRPIGPLRDFDMWRFLKKNQNTFDLVHITSNNYPRSLRGGICTIHDVTFKRWFDSPNRIPYAKFLARHYLHATIKNCIRKSDFIIAVSKSTKRELEEHFYPTSLEIEKIQVIYEGWEHLLRNEQETSQLPPRKDYLFFLGSYRLHKNLTGLLEAFQYALEHIPVDKCLVITGSSDRLSSRQRALVAHINCENERVIFTGYVSQNEIPQLYKNADALVLPSYSEGFGLPIIEAFHFEVPLIAANTTAIPEVAGDAAMYFNPFNKFSVAQAIIDFYRNPYQAEKLRRAGCRRKLDFSWKTAAAQTVNLYRTALTVRTQKNG